MSTVMWTPTRKSSYICKCDIKHTDWDNDVKKRHYKINTVIRCDDCDQLWVVRPSAANMWMDYYSVRKLRWFHLAKYKMPKQVQA